MVSKTLLTIPQHLLNQNVDNPSLHYYLYGLSSSATDLRRFLVYVGIPIFSMCHDRGIETCVSIAKELGIDLSTGYLFWPTTSDPFVSVATHICP